MHDGPLSRSDVTNTILAELIAGDLTVVSKADLARRFEGRGPSRATIYRAADDALAQAAKRGINVTLAPFTNQWSPLKANHGVEQRQSLDDAPARFHPTSAEAISRWKDLDWAGVGTAIGEVGQAVAASGQRSPALKDTVAKLRAALGGSHTSADRVIRTVLSAIQADPAAAPQLMQIIQRIGG